ncbi:MAG: branched-chain amino acid aminotransferase [Planctomycetota bacterium]
MTTLALALWNDEAGFIVSAELVLIATIAVLAMVVGLSEVANALNQELEDVASAFGSVNQSFRYQGLCGHGGHSGGTCFEDRIDFCDSACDVIGTHPTGEGRGSDH